MAVLHAIDGPLRGRIFGIPDKPRLIVGRYEIYDVVVPEPSISRKHFVLEQREDGHYLIDLGSLNGTQLNGRRISTAKLEHGDLITAGQSVLCYDETDSPTPPLSSADELGIPMLDEEEEPLEQLTDDDIVEITPGVDVVPADDIVELPDEPAAPEPPPTVPMMTSIPREAVKKKREETDIGRRRTLRVTKKGPARSPAGAPEPAAGGRGPGRRGSAAKEFARAAPAAEKCVACGRAVSQSEMDAGDGAKTRKGYLCGNCVAERQKSGIKGLEKFIRHRRRQKPG